MPRTSAPPPDDVAALARFLRNVAERGEQDPAFGAQLAQIARESGLTLERTEPPKRAASKPRGARASSEPSGAGLVSPPDPFAILRERGEEALRGTLTGLDVAALRAIIRIHRLDPARLSSRWTARERLITLIVEQVRARAGHGRAFERV